MKTFSKFKASLALGIVVLAGASTAQAAAPAISITEVAPWGSSVVSYAADWFEITNISASAINLTGWKMDDNSNSFALAVPLRGVTSIAVGQSVVFLEGNATGSTDATIDANFKSAWFGNSIPAGLTVGNYGGAGVGLSANADAVNIYDAGGTLQANVSFGASTSNVSFDNAARLNGTISQLSVVGVNGAFTASDTLEIGSVAAVPEPETFALLLAGLVVVGGAVRRRKA